MCLKNELLIRGISLVNLIIGLFVALTTNILLGFAVALGLFVLDVVIVFLFLWIRKVLTNE